MPASASARAVATARTEAGSPAIPLLLRVVLGLVAVGLVPLSIAAYQLVEINRDALTKQVQRTHAVAARAAAARVAALVGSLRRAGDAAAKSPQLLAGPASPAAQDLLASALQADPRLVGLAVYDRDGAEVVRVQQKRFAAAVSEVLSQPAGEPLRARGSGPNLWIETRHPIPELSASLRVVADGLELHEVLTTEEIGDEAALAVVAPGASLVLGSEAGAGLSRFPKALLSLAGSGKTSGASVIQDGATVVVGAWSPVPDTPWFVVSRQPAAVAEAVARRMRQRSALAVLAAVFLAALLGVAAYQSTIRPLRELASAQRRLAGLGARASRGDEIAELRESFEALERHVKDRVELGKVFLGRYQVLEVLGAGGMGTVFRGWDPKLARPVALKTVHIARRSSASQASSLVASLLSEAVTVAQLNHPNIVSVFDVEDAPDAAFIAMELVEGVSLQAYLRDVGALPPDDAIPIGASVARALAAAHSRRVVHHDVKPGNVLLGVDGAVKVTDFGIAQVLSTYRRHGEELFGTLGYLAPEVLQGNRYDEAADLFALGAVLYECLAGTPAIAGRNAAALVSSTLEAPTPRIAERVPTLPPAVASLVDALLQKNPALRPKNATVAAEMLEAVAADEGYRLVPTRVADARERIVAAGGTPQETRPTIVSLHRSRDAEARGTRRTV